MSAPPKQEAPAGLQTETGAGTSSGDVQSSSYQKAESHSTDERCISLKQERGFVRLIVTPEPDGDFGLPSTYSSMGLALLAADRLQRAWLAIGRGGAQCLTLPHTRIWQAGKATS